MVCLVGYLGSVVEYLSPVVVGYMGCVVGYLGIVEYLSPAVIGYMGCVIGYRVVDADTSCEPVNVLPFHEWLLAVGSSSVEPENAAVPM